MRKAYCADCGDQHLCTQAPDGPEHWQLTHQFIQDCCEAGPGRSIRAANMYDAYRLWALRNDKPYLTAATFGKGMKGNGFIPVKQSVMWYYGVSLTPEAYRATWPHGLPS